MELRKDYILDRWVYFSSKRKSRPKEFSMQEITADNKNCFFCPGNEHTTPPEIGRIAMGDSWKVRWFPNKFPVIEATGDADPKTDNRFFTFASGFGYHEVIAECPEHDRQLWDLGADEMREIIEVYSHRIRELQYRDPIKYVLIFKNHGRGAGTSLIHSHSQVTALAMVPSSVASEIAASKSHGKCPYCDIISIEKQSLRRCFENDSCIAFAPYASRFNYEIWIFPKRHVARLEDMHKDEVVGLSEILMKVLRKLRSVNIDYNYYLHYDPNGDNLHFHIEVTPRLATWAGFEIGSGMIINSVMPEDAAEFYRE